AVRMQIRIQRPIKSSLFKNPHCLTRSALDKNLRANANSINPKTTLSTVSQPPDLGRAFRRFGKMANKAKGTPRPMPKPLMAGVMSFELLMLPNTRPRMGPVQEKETMAKVKAMKKMPVKLFALLLES